MSPPEGAVPGDLVTVAGFEGEPDAIIKPSSKNKVSAFEQVAPDLKTNDALEATYKVLSFFSLKYSLKFQGVTWEVKGKGAIKAQSLQNVQIK